MVSVLSNTNIARSLGIFPTEENILSASRCLEKFASTVVSRLESITGAMVARFFTFS